jgi:elongation factor Ts
MITAEAVKSLREKTGASMLECKKALEKAGGDQTKALEILSKRGAEMADKKAEREIKAGLINAYVHFNQKIGVLFELGCETDFVARNETFKNLAHEICLHISAMNPQSNEELLNQPYVKNPEQTVQALINEAIGKLGENIKINRFARFEI